VSYKKNVLTFEKKFLLSFPNFVEIGMFVKKNILLYKLLAHFEVVAKFQQLKKAADFLGLHQTNLSSEMRFLESFLAVKLLERKSHGVELTSKGAELYKKIQEISKEISNIPVIISDKVQNQIITIAIPSTIVNIFQKHSFLRLKALYPNIRFRVIATEHIQDKSLKDVDLCLTYNIDNFVNIDRLMSATVKFEAVMESAFATTIQQPITEDELINNYNVCIAFDLERYNQIIDEKHELFNTIDYILTTVDGQIEVLKDEKTIAFIPKFLVKYFSNVAKVPVKDIDFSLPIYFVSPRNRYKDSFVYTIYMNFVNLFKEFLYENSIENLEVKELVLPTTTPV
jgi:DNA-binding transcriptional LysR family regulator